MIYIHIYLSHQNVIALRAVTTNDFMTADWARLPDTYNLHIFLYKFKSSFVGFRYTWARIFFIKVYNYIMKCNYNEKINFV